MSKMVEVRGLIVSLLLGILIKKSEGALDSGFTACQTADSSFESCLSNAIEEGIKFLKNGFPEYNLLPLDPLAIPSLSVGAGSGAVHLVQNYKDLMITGFTDVKVNNSHVDFDKKTLIFSTMHSLVTQKGDYDVNGKILMLPVHGKGPSTLILENCYSNHRIEFDEVESSDGIFYNPKSYTLRLHPQHARYLFENLFDGNKLLGDNINRIINEEWLTIFQDVAKGYEEAYAKIFLDYTRTIFSKTPMSLIFLS